MRTIRVGTIDAVGILTLDRRERQNRFDAETAREFLEASLRLSRDERVHAVVIRGAGGAFCGGVDTALGGIVEPIHEALAVIQRSETPFLAAIDGLAAGSGLAIAIACDLVVCSESSTIAWADPERGPTGAESSTFFLSRRLPLKAVMELVLLGQTLSAAEAKSIGLVNAVYPASRMGAEVMSLAGRLAAGPTRTLGAVKALVNCALDGHRLEAHLARERDVLERLST